MLLAYFLCVFILTAKKCNCQSSSDSCRQTCGSSNAFNIPSCPNERIEPQFDEACNCVVAYKCCPLQCPTDNVTCQPGLEYASTNIDDCGCRVQVCKTCPRSPRPTCQTECEELQQITDPFNGCSTFVCSPNCPPADDVQCSACQKQETFANEAFCNCEQKRCAQLPCATADLPPKPCALIGSRNDECGCEEKFYDEVNFCADENSAAADMKCTEKCSKKILEHMKSPCGCDVASCVLSSDADTCEAMFASSSSSTSTSGCPQGSVVRLGTTPCGSQRQICLKCDEIKQTNDTCDPKCFSVEETTDINGCPIEVCVLRQCPLAPEPVCKTCEKIKIQTDDCGCISSTCSKIHTCIADGESSTPCSGTAGVSGTDMLRRNPDVLKCGCQPRCANALNPTMTPGNGQGGSPSSLLTIGITSKGTYRLVQQPTSWVVAKSFCRIRGGDLATFYDYSEWLPVGNAYFLLAASDPTFNRQHVWINARGDGSTFRWSDGLNTPLFSTRRGRPPWEFDEPDAFNRNWCLVFRYTRFNQPSNCWRDGEKMNNCLALNWFLCKF